MVNSITIADKKIGFGYPSFIIAEAGVNHNGDISLAKKLIDAAVEAGADAVKFQTFRTESIVTVSAQKAEYQEKATGLTESQYEMLKKLELSDANFRDLSEYAKKEGILFLSTPFDVESVDFLDQIGVPAFKIASGEITNFPLLKKIAEKSKPIILSTGMSTLGEVEEALYYLRKYGSDEIILLHCTTSYPAPPDSVNLRAMETLHYAFKVPVGYSDHTEGITIPIAAVAMGACIIEKHFTLDRSLQGPDHRASLEPQQLKAMIKAVRDVELARGNGVKCLTKIEMKNKDVVRRSIIAKYDLQAGEIISEENLAIKRPGTGIDPKYIQALLQKKAKQPISKDSVIQWDMVE